MEFKTIGSSGLDYSTLYPSFSIMSSVGSGFSSHSSISKYALSRTESLVGSDKKANNADQDNFAGLNHRKKRKTVSFKDTAHITCYRKYHQDQIVNRLHLLPQDVLDPHTFVSFWGMPGAKTMKVDKSAFEEYPKSRANYDTLSELFAAGRLSLKEISLNTLYSTLRGVLVLRNPMTSSYASPTASLTNLQQFPVPDRIDVSYSFTKWERSTTVIAHRVMEQPTLNELGVAQRKTRHEYVFEISLRQSDRFISDIDTEINFILSRNQDLFAKSALIWNGRCEFKVDSSDLNWEFACHVSKVRPPPKFGHNSRNADEKYLLELAEAGYKLNEDLEFTPAESEDNTPVMSLEDLAMVTDEALILEADGELSGLTRRLIDDAELALRSKEKYDISPTPPNQEFADAPAVQIGSPGTSSPRSVHLRGPLALDTLSLKEGFDLKKLSSMSDQRVPDLVNVASPTLASANSSKVTTPLEAVPASPKSSVQKSSSEYTSTYTPYRSSSIYVNMSFF